MVWRSTSFTLFFFNDTATTEIYTLSLHDALPISRGSISGNVTDPTGAVVTGAAVQLEQPGTGLSRTTTTTNAGLFSFTDLPRSEDHTSELQSPCNLVCRLLLEKTNGTKHS